ncbi:MAG: selenocysteine-specific translation elongation factor [Armatimonadetes bacterium]|nr:selenocysteine-specific translation elongation factor [Armatimonadota bacterium]
MKHIIIGTAGHVDHGKTALIKALTGIDTDRLKEEKERGLSIELGFAHLELPSGVRAGIVDVPGHERFLKNMLMGAGGTDVVLLIVAADEGVMPQTLEHLDILRLLHVPAGLIVLTKVDLAEDEEWLALVEEEVRQAVAGTFLAQAPIVRVSAVTGEGIEALRAHLDRVAAAVRARSADGPFRLPVDRVFTMPGFGTVVTGTVASGRVRVGDAVELQPSGRATRVRGVQSHGQKAEEAVAGSRAALNLAGVEVEEVTRGDVCATPGTLRATQLVDARLQLLPRLDRPLANRTRIRLYAGTAEVLGRVTLLDREALAPGESGLVQFRLEVPTALAKGDPFVVRLYSPLVTLGGGVVLQPEARKHRRFQEEVLDSLRVRESGAPIDLLERAVFEAGEAGITMAALAQALQRPVAEVRADAEVLLEGEELLALSAQAVIHRQRWETLRERLQQTLEAFHQANRLREWMPREELRARAARGIPGGTFGLILQRLAAEGAIETQGEGVRRAGHRVTLDPAQEALAARLEERLRESLFSPPTLADLTTAEGPAAREVLNALVETGRAARVSEGLYLHRDAVEQIKELVAAHISKQGRITAADFRDLTNSSRKYAVPILEYLDSIRFTRRVGDERVLW